MRSMTRNLFIVLFGLLSAGAQASLPAQIDGQPLPTLAPVLEQVTPAVVNIHTRTRVQVRSSPFFDDPFFRQFFDLPSVPRERVQQSLGSGVVVDARLGLVLTNNHVIDGADDIAVTLEDGREFSAEFVGADRETDLALIRIGAEDLAELPLHDATPLRVGDFVVAVGNPFGLGQTVTSGIVSALGRSGLRGLEYQNFIQTDASINPGNSGGALIDLAGRLVGINTAIFTPSGGNVGIGFAIPASTARQVMEQLLRYGEVRRGSFGLAAQDLDRALREALEIPDRAGAVITRLAEDGPAQRAGLQPGDVILRVDERIVRDAQMLQAIESLLPTDQTVSLEFLRGGQRQQVQVQPLEDLDARISGRRVDERLDGLLFVRVPERIRLPGAMVEEVRRNSPAWATGLRAGDVVVAVNRNRVRDLADLREQIASTRGELALEIRRRGVAYLVPIE